jgi:hypothetical protein
MSSSADATPAQGDGLVGFVIVVMLMLVGLGFCLRTVVREHSQSAAIDSAGACGGGMRHGCLSRQHGVVDSSDDLDVFVVYDDGRQKVGLGSVGYTYPERGTKVVLESWNGHFVSVVDPVSEHRYRGSHWPKPWNGGAIFGIVVISVIVAWLTWAWDDDRRKRRRGETL